jgi:hypothetical protein
VKAKLILPIVLMLLFALSRWPGLMPWNFSAAYALMFCAGVYFPRRLVWWLPFITMFIADLALNQFYYHVRLIGPEMIGNYLAYIGMVLLGRRFSPRASWLALVSGGLLGAILFYLVSNTFSWFFNPYHNPEYTKTLVGWFIALTKGTAGYAQTWEFFNKTLMSGGLFTGLFAGAMKLAEAAEPEEEEKPAEEEESGKQPEPKEAKA